MLLVRTFRSVLLPLKAVLLNLISHGGRVRVRSCSSGSMGNGSDAVFDASPTGAINFWLPVVIFAFLFGLSMDYEVFILARMREEYDRTGDTSMAVITGIGRTGRLVTSAALILFFAFSALASSPGPTSRCSAPPWASASSSTPPSSARCWCPRWSALFGRWNWWLPSWLARALFVEPSPLPVAPDLGPAPEPERVPVGVS